METAFLLNSLNTISDIIRDIDLAGKTVLQSMADIRIASAQIITALRTVHGSLPQAILDAAARMDAEAQQVLAHGFFHPSTARYVELVDATEIFRSSDLLPDDAELISHLDHVALERWTHEANGHRDRWFTSGPRSAVMPLGQAHYSGQAMGAGVVIETQTRFELAGTAEIDIAFGGRTFAGSLILTPAGANPIVLKNPFVLHGYLAENGDLDGVVENAAGAYLGFIEGALYQRNGREIGFNFGFLSNVSNGWESDYKDRANLAGATIGSLL